MKCDFCDANAQYRDQYTGQYACLAHTRLQVTTFRGSGKLAPLSIRPAVQADRERIIELCLYFWGETEVECFENTYEICDLPAFVACDGDQVVGLASYAIEKEALNLVLLNVLPDCQGRGGGRALIVAVEEAAQANNLARIIVATSNDDLPALYLYQRHGYHLTGIKTGHLIEHHDREEAGLAGIPVRDELRLEKQL